MLIEGAALTAVSQFCDSRPRLLFGLASAISVIFAALSYRFSPFLEDEADRTDISTRAANSVIFLVGFAKSLAGESGTFNTVCEYLLFCASIATMLNVVYNFRPVERVLYVFKSA